MSVKAPLKRNVVVPVGEYPALLLSVDDGNPGPHGELWRWTYTLTDGDFANTELVGITSTTYSNFPSKSYRWAQALGHPSDVDFDAELIQGNQCRLVVTIDEKDDGGQRNVLGESSVLPPVKAQTLQIEPDRGYSTENDDAPF